VVDKKNGDEPGGSARAREDGWLKILPSWKDNRGLAPGVLVRETTFRKKDSERGRRAVKKRPRMQCWGSWKKERKLKKERPCFDAQKERGRDWAQET